VTVDDGHGSARPLRVALPPAFYDDHVSRGLPSGQEVERNARRVTVELDAASYQDLLDDAQFYIDMGVAEFGRELLGLIASARATVIVLRRAVADRGEPRHHDRPEDQPQQNEEPVQQ